jgi:3-oxoacyl-[acyl-carrier protein] reductase
MDLGLKGRNAAITGSSQGIGFAIATALAKEGCNVALSARGAQGLDTSLKELQALGVKAVGVVTDFSTEEGCSKFVAEAASQLGGMDILSAEQWEKILNLKLMAAVHTTKHALPYLKKAKGARILNVSGVTGKQLLAGAWSTALTNSAIISFSKLVAAEVGAAGITVNNICPGFTNVKSWAPRAEAMAKARNTTADQVRAGIAGQTLLGRWAEPEEIGSVAAFLVSGKNSYMTGTTVEVCGGFTRYI